MGDLWLAVVQGQPCLAKVAIFPPKLMGRDPWTACWDHIERRRNGGTYKGMTGSVILLQQVQSRVDRHGESDLQEGQLIYLGQV